MDERAGPVLLLIPIVSVVAGYLLAWRGKSLKLRKSGNLIAATVMGLVALFGSWWGLGMTIGIWSPDGSAAGPQTTGEILSALAFEILVLIFPIGAWYLCVRFAKAVFRQDQPSSINKLQVKPVRSTMLC
jgi:hypothetical protein